MKNLFLSIITFHFFLISFNSNCQLSYKEVQAIYKDETWQKTELKTTNFDSLLATEITKFQELIEISYSVRNGMTKVAGKIKATPKGPISAENINYLRTKSQKFIDLRNNLLDFSFKYRFALIEDQRKDQNTLSEFSKSKAIILSLAAALTLYDNYTLGILLMEEDKRLRKLLNEPDAGFGLVKNQLLEISLSANSIENQRTIKKGTLYFEDKFQQYINTEDQDFIYLSNLINSSPSFQYLKTIDIAEMSKKKFKMLKRITSDAIKKTQDESSNNISMFFGNSIGVIATRKGKLYENDSVLNDLKNQLQPLDILLEKTPFRLTDKFIPGHFGHVAIWVGAKNELEELGIWNNDVIKPYQSLINQDSAKFNSKNGKHIVEALRDGVQINSLHDFMNVDDVAILRPIFLQKNKDAKIESLLLTFRQIGKEYDFNFDVNTTEKIVCSEIAYVCFPSVDWETKKMAGRYTISPDNVARLCINGQLFDLITFYHDGKKCSEDDKLKLMNQLTSITDK